MTVYLILEYNQNDSNRVSCNHQKPPLGKSCKVSLDAFHPCTKKENYQFDKGMPCVFLKLNKIFNWQPEFYEDNESLPKNMPVQLKSHIGEQILKKINPSTVWVSCEGENPADVEHLGTEITYHSTNQMQGFPGNFFPFVNTKGYLQPLVAVEFNSITSKFIFKLSYKISNNKQSFMKISGGVLINIECKAWAKNIKHDRADRRGSVHFELMIDSSTTNV